MKTYQQLLLACFIIPLVFSSCAKEVIIVPTEYYIKLKVNDDWVTLKKTAWKIPSSQDEANQSSISAYDDSLGMIFTIALGKPGDELVPGTYSLNTNSLSASLQIAKMGRYLEYNSKQSANKNPAYTVVIESVEELFVRGNFKGNFLIDHKHGHTLAVTEGEFIVQRK